jgi:DNA ligase (NAD+)
MYTSEQVREFKKLTDKLLEHVDHEVNNQQEAAQEVIDLRDVINFHDHQYYVKNEPTITDYEYDKLFKRLKSIEDHFPALASEDSPTNRIARGLTKEFPTVAHIVPMLSLDNSYDEEDLVDFDRKVKDLSGLNSISYTVEPKFDGGSISLVYENDRLIRGVTRGDGIMGEEITPNIKAVKSIPLKANFSRYGIKTIEIRGEVIIQKEKFNKYNKERTAEGLTMLANPRNAASGSLRMQDAAEVARRGLEAILYHVSYAIDQDGNDLLGTKFKKRSENIILLNEMGFKTPIKEQKILHNSKDIVGYCEEWHVKRDDFGYEIDGMVIKVDDLHLEEVLGATSHHPRWAIAYKFQARQARTKLLKVEFQVGRIGTITPVAKLQPVPLGGVTVSSVSMFNEEFVNSKDIRIGDEVLVERAGDVIPYIASSIKESRTGEEQPIVFPSHCPSCGSKLVKSEEEAAWRCVNIECPAQVFERLVHFVSKDAMDIAGFGPANVDRFIAEGWLKSIPDIYRLPYDKISELEGFGERSVEKLKEAIKASKSKHPYRLLFGLGIRHVGETTAKNLMEEVNCIEDFEDWDLERINSLYDVGPKVAQSIYDFFHSKQNMLMLEELKAIGLQTCRPQKAISAGEGKLSGKTFLFTGTLSQMTRPKAEEKVEEAGGKIAGSLSSKVNYLVVGADPGSKAEKAKKMPGVQIITEEEFLDLF